MYTRKLLMDKLRTTYLWFDYSLHFLFNPFKFKRFPKKINRILVVESLFIGDLIVATPVFSALKIRYPNATIDVIVNKGMKEILLNNPNINEIISIENFTKDFIRSKKYDLAVILHPADFKTCMKLLSVKYRIGVPRVGFLSGKGFLLNKKIKPHNKKQHKVEDNLDALRSIEINPINYKTELFVTKEEEKLIKKYIKGFTVIIHPASKHKNHRWQPEKFAEVGDYLIKNYKANLIFTGLESEKQMINEVISKMKQKPLDLSGKLNLREFVALIKSSDLLLSVDTSAIHIAAAVDTSVVALFGPSIPYFWGPYNRNSKVIWKKEGCFGCNKYHCAINTYECMKNISVDEVMNQLKVLIK